MVFWEEGNVRIVWKSHEASPHEISRFVDELMSRSASILVALALLPFTRGTMGSMLQAIIDDPTPGPSVVAEAPLVPAQESALGSNRAIELRQILVDDYDNANFG